MNEKRHSQKAGLRVIGSVLYIQAEQTKDWENSQISQLSLKDKIYQFIYMA